MHLSSLLRRSAVLLVASLTLQLPAAEPAELADVPPFPTETVDFGWVIPWKRKLLERAFARFQQGASPVVDEAVESIAADPLVAGWLDDFALFMALKEHHEGAVWNTWEPGAARREPAALARWRTNLADAVAYHRFVQCVFRWQWQDLRDRCAANGIEILGDIPIFVAYDSADVWAHRELFELDDDGTPLAVAGVPPDYFCETGQLWGNPLYDWPRLQADGFAWWIERFRVSLSLVDAVRLDHFRGFESYWRVPAGEETAVNGQWVKCPGAALFKAVAAALGSLPIMAEDLGVITPAVEALREKFGFPGMRILQFAFVNGANGCFQPHRYEANCLVYSGTHDNDTTVGWWHTCDESERDWLRRYLGTEPFEINWTLIRMALASVADTVLFPLQDLLGLGGEARMNCPGRPGGNWQWRCAAGADLGAAAARLLELVKLYQRDGLPEE